MPTCDVDLTLIAELAVVANQELGAGGLRLHDVSVGVPAIESIAHRNESIRTDMLESIHDMMSVRVQLEVYHMGKKYV